MSGVWGASLAGFGVILVIAFGTWLASLVQRDVSLVDRLWSLMIALPVVAYAAWLPQEARTPGFLAAAAVLALWAVRLCLYVSWRNWGHGEDRRYTVIRARNEPNFPAKSIYLIFFLQAVLAWLVSWPFLARLAGPVTLPALEWLGIAFAFVGTVLEIVGDQQLAAFKADPMNKGRVLDTGVWRWSRHPNYFGECLAWWGFFLVALAAGGWWSIASPIVMTVLLLKVSGVALLEKDIGERRPAYAEYIRRTSAFFPWPPKA